MGLYGNYSELPVKLLKTCTNSPHFKEFRNAKDTRKPLFPDEKKERSRKLDAAYDAIHKKFGASAIQRGSSLQSKLDVGKKYKAQIEVHDDPNRKK